MRVALMIGAAWVGAAVLMMVVLGRAANAARREAVDLDALRSALSRRPVPESDAATAEPPLGVIAHGLVGPLGLILGAAHMLESGRPHLSDEHKADLARRIVAQADSVHGVLADLVLALPADVRRALDDTALPLHADRAG